MSHSDKKNLLLTELDKLKQKPVTVLSTFGHNGVDWVHSLIDGHPQVLIMPAFSFCRTLDMVCGKNSKVFDQSHVKAIISRLWSDKSYHVQRRRFIFSESDYKQIWRVVSDILLVKHVVDRIELFYIFHLAFLLLRGLHIEKIETIVVQEHVPWHHFFYEDFASKFLYVDRDVRAAIAGSFTAMRRRTSGSLNDFAVDKILLYILIRRKIIPKCRKPLLILRNEEIHSDHEGQMRQLARFLGIQYEPTMLNQTILGNKWFGESAYLASYDLSAEPPDNYYSAEQVEARWRQALTARELLAIQVVFNKELVSRGIESVSLPRVIMGCLYFLCLGESNRQGNGILIWLLKMLSRPVRRFAIYWFPYYYSKLPHVL